MSATHGPRFAHGYQFPRTSSARYTPAGPPIREQTTPRGIAKIIPLRGGRDRLFNVTGQWQTADGVWCTSSDIARDELEAIDAWRRLLAKMR